MRLKGNRKRMGMATTSFMKKPATVYFVFAAMAMNGIGFAFVAPSVSPEKIAARYDVIIAGAGTGGCGAAIQAARMGVSVLLLDETDYIGGQMNAAAVTSMDEGGTSVRERGIYRELVERIEDHYGKLGINAETAYWHGHIGVEPRIGRQILHDMLEDAKGKGVLDVALRSQVIRVLKEGDRVTGAEIEVITPEGRRTRTVNSSFLVDATEWGDVLPLTGARYRAGNTTSDAIDPKQRIQDITWAAVVRKYPNGVPDPLKMKQAPPGYDAKLETYFKSTLVDGNDMGLPGRTRPWTWFKFIGYRGMPDSKMPPQSEITRTHLNFNNDYPSSVLHLENRTERVAMERKAILKTLQLLYYIQTTLGKSDWGVADDEGYDTAFNRAQMDAWIKEQPELEPFRAILYQFPVMAYARESRRMFGTYTLKAADIERIKSRPVLFPDSIAVGDYAVDLHGSMTPKYLELEFDREEDIPQHGAFTTGPFAIPYVSLIPEKIDGLLAAEKNFSQSRLGNGATRLQPHTMLIGQAVGATAALAVKYQVQPRKLDPAVVQAVLLDAGDILYYPPVKDLSSESPEWNAVQMVAVHGILMPKDGYFGPKEPLSAEQWKELQEKWGGAASAKEMISRADLAGFLAAAGKTAKVEVKFGGSDEEKALPVTRSEAAQVIADFLKLKGLAVTTGASQSLEWSRLRPASEPTPNGSLALKKSLKRLLAAGIISSDGYWIKNAFEKEPCDGKLVKVVIERAAEKLAPGDSRPAADVLVEKRVITSADYWKAHAKEGENCLGQHVQQLLRGIDRRLVR